MQGRREFTQSEAREIRALLAEKLHADRDGQMRIRGALRRMEFYITDFHQTTEAFGPSHFDALVAGGLIALRDDGAAAPAVVAAVSDSKTAIRPRSDSDEAYIIDLCDAVLGRQAERQKRFSFLLGDAQTPLPVDAYYPDIQLVVEYRERQHVESVRLFDKRNTCSGADRGVQRQIYDQRRRDILPKHGISLVELSFDMFNHDGRKRLRRNRESDLSVVARALARWLEK